MNIGELEALSLTDLRAKSKQMEIQGATRLEERGPYPAPHAGRG